ncbi:hypothetical protein [Chondromyces apiculatus]|uniref:Alginate regulatory protein AlgP n=1 Tax=Chondromyces apiculatus DSM 436 TaxID=1192034 RepID=A0A017TAY9_9BACT|nr:hypothetical protein [Chondromyces apiculatus]EYF06042.1 alginate regulatory protein AlgP [Chondromyces apiculatus DSM 436]
MNNTSLTGPQIRVIETIEKHGQIEAMHLKAYGLDPRAANKLVNARVLTLTNGVYRLRDQRKGNAESEEAPTTKRNGSQAAGEEPAAMPAAPTSKPASVTVVQASDPEPKEEIEQDPPTQPASDAAPKVGPESDAAPSEEPESDAAPESDAPPVEGVTEQAALSVEPANDAAPAAKPAAPAAALAGGAKPKATAETKAAQPARKAASAPPARAQATKAGGARAANKAKAPKAPKPKPVVNPAGKCLCGCGGEVGDRRRFTIGHDAKLHSLVLRAFRGAVDKSEVPSTEATLTYLQTAPWMTDEIREFLGI